MKRAGNYLSVLVLAASVMCCVSCQKKYCEPGAAQPCYCSDGTTAEQLCRDDGTGWEDCDCTNKYAYWNDPATNLTWQNPQKDAYTKDDGGVTQPDAIRYCEELVLGGYDDWRLPDIDELRTLLKGNPPAETGGDCPLVEGSPRDDMNHDACSAAGEYGGPGSGGCYWGPEITGTCNKPDPAAVGHPLEYVSSTVAADNKDWVGDVLFDNGSVCFNHIHSLAEARCVRTGPTTAVKCADGPTEACAPGETRQCTTANGKTGAQVCADDGKCFGPCESSAFTPSPPIKDICEQCDQVKLTIRVPEKLAVKPKQVMAFLYAPEADGSWRFPPMRPPDGGTDYDQVIDPEIDIDKPLVMNVPGCTYYREHCLTGDYYLLVLLLNKETMPPLPAEGEYAWGMVQEPMTLGDGPQKIIEKEVMLVPCGKDTDGSGTGDACEN
jgi:hypothetical protein